MKLVALLVVTFLELGWFPVNSDGNSSPSVRYHNGKWMASVVCHYYDDPNCALSMHVQGRRINVNTAKSNENVFLSCYDSNTSIALNIENFTYEDIQDYVCLNDITQEYKHNWLNAYPYMEMVGMEAVGSLVRLTCNSIPGAPLYWILPGTAQNNNDVEITTNNNTVNSSTSAVFILKSSDNFAEYKCCVEVKANQPSPLSCTSHTFRFSDAQLLSTYEDYSDSNSMVMKCIYGGKTTPSASKISWKQCQSSSYCSTMYSSYYSIVTDEAAHTLTTTLKYRYSSSYPIYQCLYNNNVSHIFNVTLGAYAPKVTPLEKKTYYSADGYAVSLGCSVDASPEPTLTWTKTNIMDFANGSEIITDSNNYTIETQQISTTKWQTTLTVYPYDVAIHNAIYTCAANNSLGQQSLQIDTHEGPVNLELKLVSIVNSSNGTSAVKAICTFTAFPYPLNYYVNVITAEEVDIKTTVEYDELRYHATITVDFKAHIYVFPATIECTAFDPFKLDKQLQGRITVPL